jgi:tetratricopeptide (TPR) repeat protein
MQGEIDEELKNLIERFESVPESRLFAPLADAYRKSGEVDKAIEICEKGVERFPEYASAHVILGKCFYDKGATERARAEFIRVLELDPENMVALKFMGDILLAEGKNDEAAGYYRKLLAIDPTNDEVSKALKDMESGFQVKEIDLSDEGTVKRFDHPSELATMTLAGIYAAQGYYNKALKIYQDIINKEPDNDEAQEMVEKLHSLISSSEEEREGIFDGDVLSISLDDVSEKMAESTAGPGGGAKEDEELHEGAFGKQLSGEAEELASAVRELEEADKEADDEKKAAAEGEDKDREKDRGVAGTDADRRGKRDREVSKHDMTNFREWLEKMQGKKKKDN